RSRAFGPEKMATSQPPSSSNHSTRQLPGDLRSSKTPCRFRVDRGGPTAGPADLYDFVLDFRVIPTQQSRDLLYREAAHKHVAQFGQLRIGPFPPGVRGRRFVLNLGPLLIDDRGPNDAE